MARFEFEAYGRKTGKKRKNLQRVEAATEEDAIRAAEAKGLIVDPATLRRKYDIGHFYSKVVGVSHNNDDGSDRQKILRRCAVGEQFVLRRDPHNKFSRHAVAVLRQAGEQLGWLPDETASDLIDRLNEGRGFYCFCAQHTGGGPGEYAGMNLLMVRVNDAATPTEEIEKYLRGEGLFRDHVSATPGRAPQARKVGVWWFVGAAVVFLVLYFVFSKR